MTTDEEFLQTGRTFDGFELIAPLGEGGMGVVWRAQHLRLRRPVAIKFFKREAARTARAKERFLREGEAAARVRHEHIVEVFDVGVAGGAIPYIVMELLEGEDLRARLRREAPMPVTELVDLLLPVCAAVAAAHDEGVIHRDLKPENIFLAQSRDAIVTPKVVDFGVCRVEDDLAAPGTGSSALVGTPRYMPPEQVKGAGHLDARADQYALGVILYECSTGAPPFTAEALYTLLQRIVEGRFEAPRALRPELPGGFESVILRAMAARVDARFTSVRALGRALLPFASERARLYHAVRFDRDDDARPAPAAAPSVAPLAAPQTTTVSESALELPKPVLAPPARALASRRTRALLVGLAALVAVSLLAARASITPRPAQRPATNSPSPAPSLVAPLPASALPAPQPAPEARPAPSTPAPLLVPTSAPSRVRPRRSVTPTPPRPPAVSNAPVPTPPVTDTARPATTLGGVDVE